MTHSRLRISWIFRVLVFAVLWLLAPATTGAQQDTTPPNLLDLSFTPTAIDTTQSSQDVTITVRITDDLSGVSYGCVNFNSPSGLQGHGACFYPWNRISGDAFDGIYQSTATFPKFGEAGTWHASFYAYDVIGNYHGYSEQDLINLGYSTTLDVTSAQDTTPPVLQDLSFSPGLIDVSNGGQDVTITVRITDDLSGVSYGCVNFNSPSGLQGHGACFYPWNRISGDAFDGIYQSTATFPKFGEAGTWHASFYAYDVIGNYHGYSEQDLINLGYPATLDVTSNPEDKTPPVLLSVSFTPKAINTTSSSQDVKVTVRITDDLSGVSYGCVNFNSPSGLQGHGACFYPWNRISGDVFDGIYESTASFPQYGELGTWHASFYAYDVIGNYHGYSEQDLINLGFPTTLLNTNDQFPVADAGADQLVEIGLMATLNGSASYDPEAAGPLTYEWRDSNGNLLGTTASINVAVTALGTKTYTLTVTDVVGLIGTDTVNVTGQDTMPPSIIVVRPNGGEKLFTNTPYNISWAAADLGVISFFDVFYSLNGAAGTYIPVPGCSGVSGQLRSCVWSAPGPTSLKVRIRVVATDASGNVGNDISDANFSIVSGTGTITVTAPNTAVDWGIGSRFNIAWTHNLGANSYVQVEVSRDARETWQVIAPSVKNTSASAGGYNWVVTGPVSATARIRVTGVDLPVSDISNVYFTVSEPYIAVAGPAVTSTSFGYGTLRTQTWTTNLSAQEKVDVLLSTDGGATCTVGLGSNIVASIKTLTYIAPSLGLATATARICVRWTTNPTVQGLNPVNFRVEPAYIKVTYPNLAADAWTVGSTQTITWTSNLSPSENVMIELSLDGGSNYTTLLASTPSDGTQAIVVPGPITQNAKVRITWLMNNAVKDDSFESFPIN